MQSSIKIDFQDNGAGLVPVISIKLVSSEDVRDNLLKTFFQSLGGESSWLAVSFDHHVGHEGNASMDAYSKTFISLHPVTPYELPETIKLIQSRLGDPEKVTGNHNPLNEKSLGHTLTAQ